MDAPKTDEVGSKVLLFVVMALFALSGFSSLVYQVLWTRMLVFVFGSTTFASSTVLAVFMGGLALGAFAAGRVADRLKRPFLWYGILEGLIGVWALMAPHMFDAAVPLYKIIWQNFHLSTVAFSLVRFAVGVAILIIPTTAMGATLPLLSRFVTVSLDKVGDRVGLLYATNTLGAVLGATFAGFFLLPQYGLMTTMLVGVGINAFLLAIVAIASKKYEAGPWLGMDPLPAAESGTATKSKLSPQVVAVMIAFACSGGVAMIYEVAWTRTLLMVIGSSTYAFTVMLSTFLIGLFVGSVICSRVADRVRNPMAWLIYVQVLVFGGGLASVYMFNYLPYWNMQISLAQRGNPSDLFYLVRFLLSGAVLMPITLALGAVFPLVVKICTKELESVGRSVGTLYSANTLGAIVGAFLAGFLIIPALGVEHTLIWASIANLVIAVGLLLTQQTAPDPLKVGGVLACLVAMLFGAQAQGIWDPVTVLMAQTERRHINEYSGLSSRQEWQAYLNKHQKLKYFKDGACATVGVLTSKADTCILTNGHVDASDGGDMPNQILIGAYPMLFNHAAKDVAVVGWGSGVSLGMASVFPGVERLVGIELEPAVVEASKNFNHVNFKPLENKKVRVELNDGRNYLLATDEKFDAIISEPSNPWQAGVCNLFTKEFFAICRDRLKPNGIFDLWLQIEEVSDDDIKRVLSALRAEFKYTVPMHSLGCMVVMASNEPIKMNVARVEELMKNPDVRKQMAKCGINSVPDLLAHIMNSTSAVEKITQGSEPNSDNRNYLEYNVGKTYEDKAFLQQNQRLLGQNPGAPFENVDFGNMSAKAKAELMLDVAHSALKFGWPERSLVWAAESNKVSPSGDAMCAQAYSYMALGKPDEARKCFDVAMQQDPNSPRLYMQRGSYLLNLGDVVAARNDFAAAEKLAAPNSKDQLETRYWMAKTYTHAGRANVVGAWDKDAADDPSKVISLLGDLPSNKEFVSKYPDVLLVAGIANLRLNKLAPAKADLTAYTKLNPNTVLAWRGLGSILMVEGDQLGAAKCWQKGLDAGLSQGGVEVEQAVKLANQGKGAEAARVLQHALEIAPSNARGLELLQQLSEKDPIAKAVYQRQLLPGVGLSSTTH